MSHGPITAHKDFFSSAERLCRQFRYAADGVHASELSSLVAAETIAAVIQKDQEGTR